MRVTFVLPMYLNVPSGGFKVVYEYANRLQALDHQVTVLHPRLITLQGSGTASLLKEKLWKHKIRLINRPLIPWHNVDPAVKLELIPSLSERFVPDSDFIFATTCDTAFPVACYPASKGRKFYLLQSYETWLREEETVIASWKLPMHKIVVSRNLLGIAENLGEAHRTTYIPLGLDFSQFKTTIPIPGRPPRIGMLAHPNPIKGQKDGLQALSAVRKKFPALEAVLFGTEARSDDITDWPDWIDYVQRPSRKRLVEIYNSCSIFLCPSWAEGWGLPTSEAMACGCAVVTTANGGAEEFCFDGENALLCPVRRPDLLAERLTRLLAEDDLRIRLAETGRQTIRKFSWDAAVSSLVKTLDPR